MAREAEILVTLRVRIAVEKGISPEDAIVATSWTPSESQGVRFLDAAKLEMCIVEKDTK